MITILADKNIPFLMDYVPDNFQIHYFNPDKNFSPGIDQSILKSVQGLLIRTVSEINKNNLDLTLFPNLEFIATASAGINHVDIDFLTDNGIYFTSAAGCNANAVGEYVSSGIVHWCLSKKLNINKLQVGIIGVGKTGTSVYDHLRGLGCSCILYDPPRANHGKDFISASIEDLWACDVLTFHVPLSKNSESNFPTHHWLTNEKLSNFQGNLIVNASRGEVIDESALINWKSSNSHSREFIIDVWDSEPNININLALESWIATPHIAGYSNQSKRNATRMIVDELLKYFSIPMVEVNTTEVGSVESTQVNIEADFLSRIATASNEINLLESMHPMFRLSQEFKTGFTKSVEANIELFRNLRTHSKLRDEYLTLSINQIQNFQQYPSVYALLMTSKGNT